MMKSLGMFNSKNYRSDKVVSSIATISLKQAGFLCGFGSLVGGPVALVGMLAFLKLKNIPIDVMLCIAGMFIGGFLFLLGLTVPYIVYLAKEVSAIKDCLRPMQTVSVASATDQESNEVEQAVEGNPH